jgi:predicted enzyme related to lactoylglutathione lyase
MSEFVPDNAAVWFEIPVSDYDRARGFYGAVLRNVLKDERGGPNPTAVFVAKDQSAVAGHVYPGTPAAFGTGITIHLAVDDLEEGLERVKRNGGSVISPIISIPAGRFAYCVDPDGNSFGLFN